MDRDEAVCQYEAVSVWIGMRLCVSMDRDEAVSVWIGMRLCVSMDRDEAVCQYG